MSRGGPAFWLARTASLTVARYAGQKLSVDGFAIWWFAREIRSCISSEQAIVYNFLLPVWWPKSKRQRWQVNLMPDRKESQSTTVSWIIDSFVTRLHPSSPSLCLSRLSYKWSYNATDWTSASVFKSRLASSRMHSEHFHWTLKSYMFIYFNKTLLKIL